MKNSMLRAGCCALLLLTILQARADWSNFNRFGAIAEIRLDEGHAAVDLRLTDKGWAKLTQAHASRPDRHQPPEQAAMGLMSLHCQGKAQLPPSPGGFQHVDANDQSTEPYYDVTWTYLLEGCNDSLNLQPQAGLAKDDLGLMVLHRGVPVSDLLPLEKPLTLTLDSADPWRSHFDDAELIRRHAEPRSYLYVEPYEVRHELLIRLTDIAEAIDPGLKDRRQVGADERPVLQQRIGEFLLRKNPVKVGGESLRPLLDRVEFVQFSRSGMAPVDEAQSLDVRTALVGAVIAYLVDQPAQSLDLRWELFSSEPDHRAVSVILGQESFDGYMTRAEPDFSWAREDSLDPTPSAESTDDTPVADTAELTRETLPNVLQALLHNAYRAFQLREEEAVYDRLAKSLDDPLLESIYLQQRHSQIRQGQGLGGEGRVERIEILQAKRTKLERLGWWPMAATAAKPDVEVEASWKARGEVSHWGHGHPRENLYRARLALRRDLSGAWKIAAMSFLDGQRLNSVASP